MVQRNGPRRGQFPLWLAPVWGGWVRRFPHSRWGRGTRELAGCAAHIVGYFDSIEEMHRVYERYRGNTALAADESG